MLENQMDLIQEIHEEMLRQNLMPNPVIGKKYGDAICKTPLRNFRKEIKNLLNTLLIRSSTIEAAVKQL
jgi:hypothetical protein